MASLMWVHSNGQLIEGAGHSCVSSTSFVLQYKEDILQLSPNPQFNAESKKGCLSASNLCIWLLPLAKAKKLLAFFVSEWALREVNKSKLEMYCVQIK